MVFAVRHGAAAGCNQVYSFLTYEKAFLASVGSRNPMHKEVKVTTANEVLHAFAPADSSRHNNRLPLCIAERGINAESPLRQITPCNIDPS